MREPEVVLQPWALRVIAEHCSQNYNGADDPSRSLRLSLYDQREIGKYLAFLTAENARLRGELREVEKDLARLQTTNTHYGSQYVTEGVETITERAADLIATLAGENARLRSLVEGARLRDTLRAKAMPRPIYEYLESTPLASTSRQADEMRPPTPSQEV